MDKFSQHVSSFHIAGFTYWDGLKAIDSLKVGAPLEIALHDDNPYDPRAVALLINGIKLGYIPRSENLEISQALYFGHDIYEATISQIDLEQHPEHQVRATVRIKDMR